MESTSIPTLQRQAQDPHRVDPEDQAQVAQVPVRTVKTLTCKGHVQSRVQFKNCARDWVFFFGYT